MRSDLVFWGQLPLAISLKVSAKRSCICEYPCCAEKTTLVKREYGEQNYSVIPSFLSTVRFDICISQWRLCLCFNISRFWFVNGGGLMIASWKMESVQDTMARIQWPRDFFLLGMISSIWWFSQTAYGLRRKECLKKPLFFFRIFDWSGRWLLGAFWLGCILIGVDAYFWREVLPHFCPKHFEYCLWTLFSELM